MITDDDNRMLKQAIRLLLTLFFCSSQFRYVCSFHYLHYIVFFRTFNLVLLLFYCFRHDLKFLVICKEIYSFRTPTGALPVDPTGP